MGEGVPDGVVGGWWTAPVREASMTHIGFIGLGIMGKPMAINLLKGGHAVFAHSRSGVPADVTAAGAVACANGREVAQRSDIVITMVPDTPDVEQVLFAAG